MNPSIVILAGNSPKNAPWATRLAEAFAAHTTVHVHAYRHWDQEDGEIDFAAELDRLAAYLKTQTGAYCIVAKSAGVLVALQGVAAGTFSPEALVCMGVPLSYAQHRKVSLAPLIATNTHPTLYIQAEHDPAGSAQDVANVTAGHGTFMSIPGDTHDYADIDTLVQKAMEFFNTVIR